MKWICSKCGKANEAVSGICGRCMEIRSPEATLVEEPPLVLTAEMPGDPPGFWRRHFSLKKRLTRLDFLWSLLVFLATYAIAIVPRTNGWVGLSIAILVAAIACLALAATKRCRDADLNPWWAMPCLIFTPGILVLLLDGGTVGPNRFGPDPRGRAGGPPQRDAGSRRPSSDLPASEAPSSVGPRG